jgi:hypothetical protein
MVWKFLRSRKAQAAIEYMMVFGIALVLSAPFIIRAQSSMMDLRMGSEMLELQNSMDKMESAVETVNAAGSPAKRTFFVEIPSFVESGEVLNGSNGQDVIVYRYSTSDGVSQLSRSFDFNITGEVPTDSGRSRVSVAAEKDFVNISVVS